MCAIVPTGALIVLLFSSAQIPLNESASPINDSDPPSGETSSGKEHAPGTVSIVELDTERLADEYCRRADAVCRLRAYNNVSHQLADRALDSGITPGAAHFFAGLVVFRKGAWRQAMWQLKSTSDERFPLRDLYLMVAYNRLKKYDNAVASLRNFQRKNPARLAASPSPKGGSVAAAAVYPRGEAQFQGR
jgi:hypothetical protein